MIAREPGGKCGWWCVWGDDSAVARRGTRDGTDSRDVGFIETSFLPFIRGVRSARSRSRATSARVRSMGSVSPTPTRNGGSVVRPVDFVRSFGRRDAYTRCATGRSDHIHDDGSRVDPVRPRRLSPSVFVARARSRPGRSIGRDAHVDALDDERHTRADARA
jgi:hypothetical protein